MSLSNRKAPNIIAYAAMANTFLLAHQVALGQFAIYTDFEPDSLVPLVYAGVDEDLFRIELDLNHDAAKDFELEGTRRWWTYSTSYGASSARWFAKPANTSLSDNQLAVYAPPSWANPIPWVVPNGSSGAISSALSFEAATGLLGVNKCTYWAASYGPWVDYPDDHSIGVRISFAGEWHYGWIRAQASLVKDFAINPISDEPILAVPPFDASFARPAHTILAQQIGTAGNFSDITVNFKVPLSETGISEYRIIAVKQDSLPTFDESKALALAPSQYMSVSPVGADFLLSLNPGLQDSDGDGLSTGTSYHFLVMSMADGISATNNNLWSCSPVLKALEIDRAASNLMLADIADHNDARDFQLSFDSAPNETGIASYRAILSRSEVEPADAEWAALLPSQYVDVLPVGGGTLLVNFPSTLLDAYGDSVRSGSYHAFVRSIGDGVDLINDVPADANASEESLLNTRVPLNLAGFDAGELGAADLSFTFDPAIDEAGIAEYRIVAVAKPSALLPFPTEPEFDSLIALAADRYVALPAVGGPYSGDFSGKMDIEGNEINGVGQYVLLGFTVGDNVNFMDGDAMDTYGPPVTLDKDIITPVITGFSTDYLHPNAAAFHLDFTKAPDETSVAAYRIYLAPEGVSVEESMLIPLGPGSFQSIATTGLDQSLQLDASLKDINGASILPDVFYKVYVLAEPDGVGINLWGYAESSLTAKIDPAPFVVHNLGLEDAEEFDNGRDIEVSFDPAITEDDISSYRVFALKSGTTISVADALALPVDRFVSVTPDGSSKTVNLSIPGRDTDGDLLIGEADYDVKVVSVFGDVGIAVEGSVSLNLEPITAKNLVASSTGASADASSIVLTCDRPTLLTRIEHYRIYVLEFGSTTPFDKTTALSLPPDQYFEVPGSPATSFTLVVDNFPVDLLTADTGQPIVFGEGYQIYILSITDAATNSATALSEASNGFTLIDVVSGLEEELASPISFTQSASQIELQSANLIDALAIYDTKGRLHYSTESSSLSEQIEIGDWPAGMYFITAKMGQSNWRHSFVIVR